MFFPHRILSRVLALSIAILFLAACIEDNPVEMDNSAAPTVSITATPFALTEVEQTVLTLTVTLSEVPLEGGLEVSIDSETPNALEQFNLSTAVYQGATLVDVNADMSGLTLNVVAQTATISLPVVLDDIEEDAETFIYTLALSEAYIINPTASAFSVTIFDRPPDILTLGITATPIELIETEQTVLTLTTILSAAPPAGGVDVTIDSQVPGALDELDFAAATYNGAVLATSHADASGFTLNVFEQTATVMVPVLDDGVDEGPETLAFTLAPSGDYTIDPAASAVSVTIFDISPDVLTVGITAAPTELFESERTMLTLTLMLSEMPPAGGVNITIESDTLNALRELDVLAAVYAGARLVAGNADRSGFTLNVFEPTATVTLPVFDDGVPEGPETLTFDLVPSEAYAMNPAARSVSITIFDMAP